MTGGMGQAKRLGLGRNGSGLRPSCLWVPIQEIRVAAKRPSGCKECSPPLYLMTDKTGTQTPSPHWVATSRGN
jgi:hypothetical protein